MDYLSLTLDGRPANAGLVAKRLTNTMTDFQQQGYALIDRALSNHQLQVINHQLNAVSLPSTKGGIRNADKKYSSIDQLAKSDEMLGIARRYLSGEPAVVRVILFDKTPDNNWLVAWHQDRTVAVSKRFDAEGWGPWSIKDAVHHVQPPLEVLNNMVTLRVHIDDATVDNGCLQLIPGSHHAGMLHTPDITSYVSSHKAIDCPASAGSVLVMRPHILHASGKGISANQRRVIHIEYSSYPLPDGIDWA